MTRVVSAHILSARSEIRGYISPQRRLGTLVHCVCPGDGENRFGGQLAALATSGYVFNSLTGENVPVTVIFVSLVANPQPDPLWTGGSLT